MTLEEVSKQLEALHADILCDLCDSGMCGTAQTHAVIALNHLENAKLTFDLADQIQTRELGEMRMRGGR